MNSQELKARRNKIGLTQRHLAFLCGVREATLWKWENERLPVPERIEQTLKNIESRLNKCKNHAV
jgi:DNA-binding XRE family transcriptional regulator